MAEVEPPKNSSIHLLPPELLIMILKKLNYKSICHARLTCKQWQKMIKNFKLAEVFMAKTFGILVVGGTGGTGSEKLKNLSSVEFIGEDCLIKEFPKLPDYSVFRSLVLHDGNILICGIGDCNNDGLESKRLCLMLKNGIWKKHSVLNHERLWGSSVSIKSGTFIFGGRPRDIDAKFWYEYLPKGSSRWIRGKTRIPRGFVSGCAIATKSEQDILLIGGWLTGKRILKFNVKDHSFEELPINLNEGRFGAQCAFIPGTNKIMITGGSCLKSTEILDLDQGSIVMASPMNFARHCHGIGIITVNDVQRLAVFGGSEGTKGVKFQDTIELYNMQTQKWELSEAKLKNGRYGFGFISANLQDISNCF